jgi:hypothetical protein
MLKENYQQSRMLNPAKLSFKSGNEIKTFFKKWEDLSPVENASVKGTSEKMKITCQKFGST